MNILKIAGLFAGLAVTAGLAASPAFAATCTRLENWPTAPGSQKNLNMTGLQANGTNCGTNRANVGAGLGLGPTFLHSVGTTLFVGISSESIGTNSAGVPLPNNVCRAFDNTPSSGGGSGDNTDCGPAVKFRGTITF